MKALKPGQGIVAVVASPLGGGDGLVVVGGDDEGTLNAANELAAYLPRLWGATGARVGQAEAQAARGGGAGGDGGGARGRWPRRRRPGRGGRSAARRWRGR